MTVVLQSGALTALLELLDELESAGGSVTLTAVTGVSIGAVTARRPTNRDQAQDRVDELRYGNRLLQDRRSAERINRLAGLIDTLARLVPEDRYPPELRHAVDEARLYKKVRIVPIDMQNPTAGTEPPAQDPADGNGGHGDFSPRTVRRRFDGGYRVVRRILAGGLFAPPASSVDPVPTAAGDAASAAKTPADPDTVLGVCELSPN